MKKICAIIPSYNEEKNIGDVIKGVQGHKIDVVVIDDGSNDKTGALAGQLGAAVITHPKKKGKGASIKDGLEWAASGNYDYIITIDADGQHNPHEAPSFINAADADAEAGIIIGNRLSDPQKMPKTRLRTNKFMSLLISALCGQNIPDTQCGYKLIKREALKIISIKSRKFEIESELLIKAAKAGFKIKSIPISSIYAGEKSKINPIADAIRFIRFFVTEMIKR